MFRSKYDHPQKAQQHVEETIITLIIVHKIELQFYMTILVEIN
jgi:hypothetical protein